MRAGKGKAMLARLDHRPRLTALLALSTAVLVVVVITLATLLVTSPPAVSPGTSADEHAQVVVPYTGGRTAPETISRK